VVVPPVTAQVKFHPGHYIELDPGSGCGDLACWQKVIAGLKGTPGVVGVALIQSWAALEGPAAGDYSPGYALVDALLAACKAAGLQFILGWEDRSFSASNTWTVPNSYGILPAYFNTLNGGKPAFDMAPSGTTYSGSLRMMAQTWTAAVGAREVALAAGLCARYDADPNFEMLRTPETAVGDPNVGNYAGYIAQLQGWMAGARAACPHTELSISGNFLDSSAQWTAMFTAQAQYGVAGGGPDVKLNLAGNPPYGGTSNITFNGFTGGKDWRGVFSWVAEVQYPDSSGTTQAALYDEMFSGALATGGSVAPNYFIWGAAQVNPAWTLASTLAYIKSINGAVNTARPSSLH
jgi:hypothetical protein